MEKVITGVDHLQPINMSPNSNDGYNKYNYKLNDGEHKSSGVAVKINYLFPEESSYVDRFGNEILASHHILQGGSDTFSGRYCVCI